MSGEGHCLACHSDVAEGVMLRDGIRVRHADFISTSVSCSQCHDSVAHRPVPVSAAATMTRCLACHNDRAASAACAGCHTTAVATPPSPHPSPEAAAAVDKGMQWKRTHLLGDQVACAACHPGVFCASCHGTELPHPDSVLDTHGRAASRASQACTSCHDKALCEGCHTMEMPHPKTFLPQHAAVVGSQGDSECLGCHMRSNCDECHARHLHPGLNKARIGRLREGG
jgi:hypothetical protein